MFYRVGSFASFRKHISLQKVFYVFLFFLSMELKIEDIEVLNSFIFSEENKVDEARNLNIEKIKK